MSIEEAEYVLSEAIITEPSIMSYTYISAEEINEAIDIILENKLKEETKIKELEKVVLEQAQEMENMITNKFEKENNKTQIFRKKYLSKYINKIKNNGINTVTA